VCDLPAVAVTVKFEVPYRNPSGRMSEHERRMTAHMRMTNRSMTGSQVVALVQRVVSLNGHNAELVLERRYHDGLLVSVGRNSEADGHLLVVPELGSPPFFRLSDRSLYSEVLVVSHSWNGSRVAYSQAVVAYIEKFAGELSYAYSEAAKKPTFPSYVSPQNA
jgi:hypothetical protein